MTLPFTETAEQAHRLAEEHQDTFHIDAFHLQLWLGGVAVRAVSEYADRPPLQPWPWSGSLVMNTPVLTLKNLSRFNVIQADSSQKN